MIPPSVNNFIDVVIPGGGASTAAIPTGVGGVRDREISMIANTAFDVVFGPANVVNPSITSTHFVPVRTVFTFLLGPKDTHFKISSAAGAGTVKVWRSSRT